MLIQGIMKCGLGNWLDISEQFVKLKTPEECEDHYFSVIMKQEEKIKYEVVLTQRQLHTEDCLVDENKLKDIQVEVEKYRAAR